MTKPRYHCMTCGLDFDTKPEACPSCGQSKFADRADEQADPAAGELAESEDEEDEDEDEEEEEPAPRHVPGNPAPGTRAKPRRKPRKR